MSIDKMFPLGFSRLQQFFSSQKNHSNQPFTFWLKQSFNGSSNAQQPKRSDKGQVYLIGAGPGDAELLTLKAHRLIQQADVVMYDWLVNPDIIAMIPRHVERVFVGKKCGQHSMQQADICELMVEVASSGKNIVRLKGGDPAIFARAAEECDILAKHQIDFAIVPGITAASGASAYAGIPLTHRECAQSVRFITAHLKSATDEPNWQALVAGASASQGETLVFYMGLKRIDTIMQRLKTHGLPASTAVAVIDQASTTQQQVCIGTLDTIAQRVTEQNFQGPAVTIVGEVVNKRHSVNLSLLSQSVNELRVIP
ncbi:uroporphyrinogen-III C-methyltransferase [uncultured Paraglaciecola sp.]|uniref:uroporphyrinogen-III C-methyltransferase n=1 Tax=uncultured Paraglaciecola sp. TaxID=1765024 RepID=UPI0030DCB96F|tara:strand:- start:59340 stop:60275 length:936 start_codon:yes stop_codon:yes gene_type:complete